MKIKTIPSIELHWGIGITYNSNNRSIYLLFIKWGIEIVIKEAK